MPANLQPQPEVALHDGPVHAGEPRTFLVAVLPGARRTAFAEGRFGALYGCVRASAPSGWRGRRYDHEHPCSRAACARACWHGARGVGPWTWLAGGFVLAFAVPFLLADVLDINRDVFYGLYALSVIGLFAVWSRSTGYDLVAACRRRWALALTLGLAFAGLLALMVVRTEDATARPEGVDLVAAVAWRGVVYGVTDGLLLSVFPILVVFAALAGTRLDRSLAGKLAIGAVALVASVGMTAVPRGLQRLPLGQDHEADHR